MSVPSAVRRLQAGLPAAQLRHGLDSALHLFGFAEPRADRLATGLTIHLGPDAASPVTLVERLGGEERTYRFETAADDPAEVAERVATIVGGRGGVRIKVLVDPGACFIRSLDLPSAALARMRAVLTEELEAATPFRAAAVYSDWFVEGEDVGERTLRVRHVVIKRARLDPLLDALAGAGLSVGPAAVGRSEDQTMPVDLLSHGHRSLPALFGQGRKGDALLLAGAACLVIAAFWGWRSHQEATLTGLGDAFAAARLAAGPPPPPPVQAGIAAILAGRAPPLARTWDALAAALPAGTSATSLHLDHEGALVTLVTTSEDEAMAALWRLPGLGPPVLRGADDQPEGARRLVVHLPGATR